jgi:hypothetical protein
VTTVISAGLPVLAFLDFTRYLGILGYALVMAKCCGDLACHARDIPRSDPAHRLAVQIEHARVLPGLQHAQ